MKPAYSLALLAALAFPVAAQSQVVRGVVVDAETEEPIPGVHVELVAANGRILASGQTGANGTFLFTTNATGEHLLRATHIGYQALQPTEIALRRNESAVIMLRMGREVHPLEPLVVVGRTRGQVAAFRERSRNPGFGRFITREEVNRRSYASGPELLRGMAGIDVVSAGTQGNLIFMRRAGQSCQPTIYIDGVVVDQQFGPLDSWTRASSLEGVEVYAGAGAPYPIQERPSPFQLTCGVVAFWTRDFEDGGPVSLARVAGLGGFALVASVLRALVN